MRNTGRAASGCTVPWRSASELSRLRPKRLVHLVHPDAHDVIVFFPDVLLTNGDITGDPSLIALKTPVIGDEVTLSSAFVNVKGSGLTRDIKLITTSGHNIGWIHQYKK